jgi:hypothetical protein
MKWITEPTNHREYLMNEVSYTHDGRLLDYNGNAVMMKWEDPIMRDAASLICRDGGKILNVGFGLGLIDNYIQSHKIDEHWIIEAHPGVIKQMKKEEWDKKPNVTCIFDKWQNVYKELPKFDGIYFDTWQESSEDFHKIVEPLLNIGAKYLWFSGQVIPNSILKNLIKKGFKLEETITTLEEITKEQKRKGGQYWNSDWKEFKQNLLIFNKQINK